MWFRFFWKPPAARVMYQPIPEVLLFVCLAQSAAIICLIQLAFGSGKLLPVATPVPPIPWQTVEFTRDGAMHHLRHSEDVENAWRNYETKAFVHIANPQAYSLLPNKGAIDGGAENVFMISAHHQLHCLKRLQLRHVAASPAEADLIMDDEHTEHCFDYLRQAIRCAADSTLEGVNPEKPGILRGYGATHQCRAWDGPDGLDTWRRMHCAAEGLGCHRDN